MKKLVVILACLVMASSAFAVADTDPDGIGIWFDLTADTNFVASAAYVSVPTYLIISNPSAPSIGGWECEIVWDQAACSLMGGYVYNGSALNVFVEPQFAVGLAVPLPADAATLLLTMSLFVMNVAGTEFQILPSPAPSGGYDVPLYINGDDLSQMVPLQNATGYAENGEVLPCASINQGEFVATENTTWSEVKSLW